MASVTREKYGWRVSWREGGKRTDPKTSERFGTEAEAIGFRDAVNRAGQHWPDGWIRGRGFTGSTITGKPERGADERGAMSVYEWAVDYYRDDNRALKAKPASRERYRYRLGKNLKGSPFGDAPLFHATRESFQAWVDGLKDRGLSHNYVEALRGTVGKALRAAHVEGIIAKDPALAIMVPGSGDDEKFAPFFANEEQVAALIAGTPEKYRLGIRTLSETGLRLIEFYNLAPGDVHYNPRTGAYWLRVRRSKTHSGLRSVTVGEKLGIELMALADMRRGADSLFDLPHTSNFYRQAWYPARAAAGLPSMRIHDLRHSHASWLLANGATLFVVSKRLGHKTLRITSDLYGQLSHEDEGLTAILNRI